MKYLILCGALLSAPVMAAEICDGLDLKTVPNQYECSLLLEEAVDKKLVLATPLPRKYFEKLCVYEANLGNGLSSMVLENLCIIRHKELYARKVNRTKPILK